MRYIVVYRYDPQYKGLDVYGLPGGGTGDRHEAQRFPNPHSAFEYAALHPHIGGGHLLAQVVEDVEPDPLVDVPNAYRRRFSLTPDQEARVREIFREMNP